MKKIVLLYIVALLFVSCNQKPKIPEISIIPKPVETIKGEGAFYLDNSTVIYINDKSLQKTADFLVESIKNASGTELEVALEQNFDEKVNFIGLELSKDNNNQGKEAYTLLADEDKIIIKASNPAGIFYGLQTLYQLMPPEIFAKNKLELPLVIPAVKIEDYPRFAYRGMHLDVSRHFFPKEFIKKYINLIAFHKMNTFHWHLVDNNGWRIEIKKYPKLTEIGAWRVDRNNVSWREREPAKPGEKATYGGFYTQDDIREIIQFAKDRQVTIIPEIEMPAHVLSAIASYPELSCTGDSISIPPGGIYQVNALYCAGKESTFEFLENVLTEVMDLFPSKYIHIGGDEANKAPWEKCSYCQKRMKTEGLKDVSELQSYFIRRIEKFLNSKGRELIGWDEILEGGLAPEATVMSWRGISGGIAAAKAGHDAIMTPGSHCYFDHYQGDPRVEPEAIGGYTTVSKTYSYEPIPEELSAEEAKHILGAQGNVWTEWILTPEHAEYMAIPRMTALAEVDWSPKESRNWDDFNKRLQKQFKRFDNWGVNYAHGTTLIDIKSVFKNDTAWVELFNERYHPEIHYTTDGTEPDANSPKYEKPFAITKTITLKAILVENGKTIGLPTEKLIAKHKGLGAKVTYLTPYYKYKGQGDKNLTDGMTGGNNHNDGFWQAFYASDMEVILDFGKELEFSKLSAGFYQRSGSWIFSPKSVEYYKSDNGKHFTLIGKVENTIAPLEKDVQINRFTLETEKQKARFLKVKAHALINCPKGHIGEGKPAWIFADEITVD